MRRTVIISACLLALTGLVRAGQSSQVPLSNNIIDMKTGTWTGVIVERSCFQKLGAQKANAASHQTCAMECVQKGQPLAILTDDDGLMTITGEMAADKFAKIVQYLGKRVEVSGTSGQPTGNYIPRQIQITTIAPEKS
jgi:hypothetical protein